MWDGPCAAVDEEVVEVDTTGPRYRKPADVKMSGGVLPLCVDPDTGAAHMLLGVAKGKTEPGREEEWCPILADFHGFVDLGETREEGAAREAEEESLGLIGSREAILSLLCSKRHHRTLPRPNHGTYFISLGVLDASGRDALCAEFATRRMLLEEQASSGQRVRHSFLEVRAVRWISVASVAASCREAMTGCPRGYEQHHGRTCRTCVRVGSQQCLPLEGAARGEWLRNVFQSRFSVASLYGIPGGASAEPDWFGRLCAVPAELPCASVPLVMQPIAHLLAAATRRPLTPPSITCPRRCGLEPLHSSATAPACDLCLAAAATHSCQQCEFAACSACLQRPHQGGGKGRSGGGKGGGGKGRGNKGGKGY
eukprot:Hpha_TRINITY_DN34903_c0_g1::TRINITY_DN34903_c0_g1_i1::g.184034::m.184034